MTSEEALIHFLAGALQGKVKDRYLSLVSTKRGEKTFLSDLWHNLENKFNDSKVIAELPQSAWASSAYSFNESIGFGRNENSMKEAFDIVGDGSLIIDSAGKYGIYKPEDMIDNIKFIKA